MVTLAEIEITDRDIDEIEAHFRRHFDCSFAEKNTREALKCISSRDIQAGPGSGKTTVLVAKLAILSKKGLRRDTGICVLSHTNVARKEVETRLASHPTAYRLLSYPHFMGTIQSFVDRFLALPYLRNKGIEVYAIDNDRFAGWARGAIGKYPKANYWLKMHIYNDYLANLRYEGPTLKLGSGIGQINLGEDTPTYKQLLSLKDGVSKGEGIFRFDDMYAFAEAYTDECPFIVKLLRKRFPLVFIDEMQDTNALQERILNRLFGEECVLQRFGDVNQSIYSGDFLEDSQTSFPKDDAIDLLESRRFGKEIAAFASTLTSSKKQLIKGNFAKPGKRVMFLFDNDSIHKVIGEFGDFVLAENKGQVPSGFVAKAVGFRKTGQNEKPENIPFKISDYWSEFKPDFVQKSGSSSSLIGYVVKAHCLRDESEELRESYSVVITGILRFLHIQGAKNSEGLRFNESRLIRELEIQQDKERFQKLLADMCLSHQALVREYWTNISDELWHLTNKWCGQELFQEAKSFLEWDDKASAPAEEKSESAPQKINVMNHNGLQIEVGTIHSVKGQTHSATLVLETYLRKKHDMEQLLPYIKGESDASGTSINDEVKEHMKRIFVGGTRPREILGIAMHKNHLNTGDLNKLQSIGWAIKDLSMRQEGKP